ncbi:protein suex-1-like [Lutzomyia longipalpis]|uniref:protein suex-1-like n=1 Tax=Lutzomyia longipalpis TaxID=7200 RepID=UPI0024839668|nr:protein suex-1-like [Lutzomyia longipalpis]
MKAFIVLCLGVALVAGAAIEKEAEPIANEQEQAAEATGQEKKQGKRGLFDLGYGYGGYGDFGHSAGLYGGYGGYDGFGYGGLGGLDLGVSKTIVKHHHHTVPVVVERKVPVAVPVVQKVIQKVPVPTIVEKHVPYLGYGHGLSGYSYGVSHHGYHGGLGHGYGFDYHHY